MPGTHDLVLGLRRRTAIVTWFNRCVGGIFVALGIRLALAQEN